MQEQFIRAYPYKPAVGVRYLFLLSAEVTRRKAPYRGVTSSMRSVFLDSDLLKLYSTLSTRYVTPSRITVLSVS